MTGVIGVKQEPSTDGETWREAKIYTMRELVEALAEYQLIPPLTWNGDYGDKQ